MRGAAAVQSYFVPVRLRSSPRRAALRPYEIVVLSDHGQTQGATFKQRNGYGLDELVAHVRRAGLGGVAVGQQHPRPHRLAELDGRHVRVAAVRGDRLGRWGGGGVGTGGGGGEAGCWGAWARRSGRAALRLLSQGGAGTGMPGGGARAGLGLARPAGNEPCVLSRRPAS